MKEIVEIIAYLLRSCNEKDMKIAALEDELRRVRKETITD